MRLVLPSPAPCIECGSSPIHHRIGYWIDLTGLFFIPLAAFFDVIGRAATAPIRKSRYLHAGRFYQLMEYLNAGEFKDEPDDKTPLHDHVLWEEAKTRGINMREFRPFGFPGESFIATFPDNRTITFQAIPFPYSAKRSVWWVDTKSILKKKLRAHGIPVPQGGAAFTLAGAKRIFNKIKHPAIVKPYTGSASRHTILHINTEIELERAFKIGKEISPLLIIEEELQGAVYRPTIVNGKLVATIRRDRPQVVGDGIHTVRELVETANTHPARQGPYFQHIKLGDAEAQELALQHLLFESIPASGRTVYLHSKINWSVGGTTADVSEDVHSENKALFEEIAQILHAPIVGIDFIIEDISRSWKEQAGCGVIECNSKPFFDNHHLPFEGQPHNVAAVIWDLWDKKTA